jgi:hypothetical protein
MKMKKTFCISFILIVIFMVSAGRSFACSCLFTDEPVEIKVKKAFADSKAIFSGEVLTIIPQDDFRLAVRIRLDQKWKGRVSGREITVTTPKDSGMCGYNFVTGKKYLVYTYQTTSGLATNSCSRTTVLEQNGDVRYLDKLKGTGSGDDPDTETVKDRDCGKKADKKLPSLPADIKTRSGQDADKLLADPAIRKRLKKLLGKKNYESFSGYFETAGPIKKKGNFLFASGCMIRACTRLESALAIDPENNTIHAAIYNQIEKTKYFNERDSKTPSPIIKWAKRLEKLNKPGPDR